ncbi:glycosyltransferase family 4 protein [Gloeobacter morelensis]|uniref:glycosyltransferase family 4 protein n=1 Tax=Gloeobacter morelensis TaxID=2907343 RepID=UPI001E4BB060|nr:MraY family glycosyltransferase [Gloeobacter morelensis]
MPFLIALVAVACGWLGATPAAWGAGAVQPGISGDLLSCAIAFVVATVAVLVITPLVRTVGLRQGWGVDRPDERKVHTREMVRLGGVSIFLGITFALLLVWGLGSFGFLPPQKEYEIWGVTIGAVLFFFLGLSDDFRSQPAWLRLLVQVGIATGAWSVGVDVDVLSLPGVGVVKLVWWLSLPITILWLVGVVNAINFIDGLDGLAAGVCGIAAVVTFSVTVFTGQWQAALISAAVAGGALGFLRYNFNPAQIFMGDGGAYFLGFLLGGLSVIGVVKSVTTVALFIPFCILAVPIFDTASVILQRLRTGDSPFKPDKRHLHHRLLKAGLSHRSVVVVIYALTLWAGSIALAISGMPAGGTYTVLATLLLAYIAWEAWRRSQASRSS